MKICQVGAKLFHADEQTQQSQLLFFTILQTCLKMNLNHYLLQVQYALREFNRRDVAWPKWIAEVPLNNLTLITENEIVMKIICKNT